MRETGCGNQTVNAPETVKYLLTSHGLVSRNKRALWKVDDSAVVNPLSDANDSNRSPLSHNPKQVLVHQTLPTVSDSSFLALYFIPLVFYKLEHSTNNSFLRLLGDRVPCPCETTSDWSKTWLYLSQRTKWMNELNQLTELNAWKQIWQLVSVNSYI